MRKRGRIDPAFFGSSRLFPGAVRFFTAAVDGLFLLFSLFGLIIFNAAFV
jgi:hypothetical protein